MTLYIGKDNETILRLYSEDRKVEPNTLTRAVIDFGEGILLDTDVDAELFFGLTRQDLTVSYSTKLGTEPKVFPCKLTCYDADHPLGIAWDEFNLELFEW